ncbi:putative diguanylate cyclase with PAS/PAC sensor [Magnetospirillum gryphiswaldense MSR-1 v2]|uniref:Diguanylate cyclase with PAS/PAC sensor n=1 Tax=Magnetospirillum gryphiswaldense (strain DSM 6361 / JCM 21280 / NBRC 15271 / MSR-1) TaxID=431944 RepID=V6EYS5_MAGGM|nr:diguanylate cyclase [Magnetospirillum gryphiswaldense]CDK98292.1 putative diguanylate cyclase with PAS/PAC sensor [Magnetospirillum gryphiswaldense MSR-1 v2]
MSDFAQRLTRALTIRYVAVLVIIGALAVGSFLGLVRVLMDAESGTAIVNASARQRALVERAADLAVQVQAGAVQAGKIEQDLHATLDRLETVHLGLLQGMPELKRPQPPVGRVKALYYGPDGALDADLRLFLQHGRGVLVSRRGDAAMAGDVAAMVEAVKGRLGQQLDALTGLYQQENLDRLRHMFGYHAAVVALVLFLLVLSAAAVFRPMVTRIRDDLGERLRIEKNLRESEDRLWRMLQESPVGVSASRRKDGLVVFANARFCEILRTDAKNLLGQRARNLYVDNQQLSDIVHELKDKGEINDAEVEFRRFDGEPFHSLLTVKASHFEGEPVNLAWIYDISAMKAAEEKLKLTAKVVESASEAVVITNAYNEIEYVNPAFTAITEYTAEEVLGQNPALWRSGRHDAEFYQSMWAALNDAGRWRGEIWNRRKSGEFYAEWLSIVAIKDDAGVVSHYIAIFSDITHRKEDEERVWRQANFDALTGLPNRALFVDRLSQAIRQSKRDGKKFALFFIDLDGFKQVNDSLGHAAGDLLLQQTAQRLVDCVRSSDTVARLAGDEFTCIVQGVHDSTDTSMVARKILERLAAPFDLDGKPAHVQGSVGIALYPDDGADGAELLKMADEAMYRVKRRGKNSFEFA